MNYREPTSVPQGTGQSWLWLALLTLLLLVVARAWSRPMLPPPTIIKGSKPYLGVLGAPPVRFQLPAPPPDLVTRPPAAAPPLPIAKDSLNDVIPPSPTSETTAADKAQTFTTASTPTTANTPAAPTADNAATTATGTPQSRRTPPPILRDDIRPQVHAEDFLPFFQIPTTQPSDVIVPVPRTPSSPLPPSSATYTQTPQ